MKPISPGQVRAINVTLGVRGLADDKDDIIAMFTNGRTSHINSMSMEEARALLMAYNTDRNENDKMMRKLFAMVHEMGWVRKVSVVSGGVPGVVQQKDYTHLYEWILKYGYLKKELRKYTYNELPKLLSQFEFGPYKSYISKL